MWNLDTIASRRAKNADGSIRIAFVHLSFRLTARSRAVRNKSLFSAHFPALGLLNLAQQLRDRYPEKRLGSWVGYFDEEAYESRDELAAAVSSWLQPAALRIIGMSTYTSNIDHTVKFCERFAGDDHLVVLGGAHVTVVPDDLPCHVIVRGEGSAGLVTLLEKLGQPDFGDAARDSGICCLLGESQISGRPYSDQSIVTTSPPGFAYDLLPDVGEDTYSTSYTRLLGKRPQVYVCTQSCRARCSFCSTYLIHREVVARDVQAISDDLQRLRELGYDSIELHDDDLLQHKDLDQLLDVLRDLGLPWFCYARSETLDDALAARMADSGCRRVFLGLEAMSQQSLDYLNKKTTVAQNSNAVQSLARHGIGAVGGFIVGLPDHTSEDVLAELDRYLDLPLFAISCNVLTPDPRTREFQRARRRGGELRDSLGGPSGLTVIPDVAKWGLDQPVGLPAVCKSIDKRTLNDLVAVVEYAFYSRPSIVAGLHASASSPEQNRLVRDYLEFVRGRLLERLPGVTDELVVSRASRLLGVA